MGTEFIIRVKDQLVDLSQVKTIKLAGQGNSQKGQNIIEIELKGQLHYPHGKAEPAEFISDSIFITCKNEIEASEEFVEIARVWDKIAKVRNRNYEPLE